MYKIGIYYSFQTTVCCPGSNPTKTTDSHLKIIISTNCCIHMAVPPDDGPRYARKMQGLMNYTKNKLCIKLVFLHNYMEMHGQRNIKFTDISGVHNYSSFEQNVGAIHYSEMLVNFQCSTQCNISEDGNLQNRASWRYHLQVGHLSVW